ncbi:MAG: class I SAM-dependent methyltransferase [bacterium]|nr:class I SAM-dependent methyltransferase [bacterium]
MHDLYLLEAHQVADLSNRAPDAELAAVLHANPSLRRFLVARCPSIGSFLSRLLTDYGPAAADELHAAEESLVWELADWIAYQRAPEAYDAQAKVDWDISAVTTVVSLQDKIVIDCGAGTGRVAFDAAPMAHHVFAVEPVAKLRQFMRDKATRLGVDNLHVLDGFLHSIPLPADQADVLLTCQAIGWHLPEELQEIDRVVRRGGMTMHLFGAPGATEPDNPLHQPLLTHGYQTDVHQEGDVHIRRYWKRM